MKNLTFLLAFVVSFLSLNAFATIQKFSAQYSLPVPVGSEIPESARLFQVDYFVVQDSPEQLETAFFVLPRELTGKRVSVGMQVASVKKEDGVVTRTLQGSAGSAQCTGPWKSIKCTYELNGIEINEIEVNQFLKQRYGDDAERISELQSVAKDFDADPIGVISVQP